MLRVPVVTIAILILGSHLRAQNSAPADPETISILVQQVKDLQRQTIELQQKVKLLEAEKATAPSTATFPPTPEPPNTQASPTQASDNAPPSHDDSSSMHEARGIQWRGFGQVDYKALNQRSPELRTYGFVPGSSGNFYTGDFDLFLTSRLTEKTSVLAEIDFEEGDAQSFNLDLRRMLLKVDANDHLKFSFGRYQTSIGYYNWAFRSAAWLQTTADRPLVMEFASNGGLLPTQAVGVSVTGSIPSGKFGLNYVAEYGSSDTVRPDINGDGLLNDENNGNQVNLGFFLQPDRLRGLRVGGSFYHDQISDLMSPVSGGSVQVPAVIQILHPVPVGIRP